MRKVFFLFVVFGLIGLMYSCELGTTALSESDISDDYNNEVKKSLRKLISTGNCKECPFGSVDISGKDLNHKDLSQANLSQANLKEAYLNGAHLKRADLSQAVLDGTDLTEANLTWANLNGADLTGANLNGADLKGANLDSAIKCKTIFSWGEDNSACE